MNHQEAAQSNAAEKYLLGELPADLREQFEEHYFDCRECADNVRLLASLLSAGRICVEGKAEAEKPAPRARTAQRNRLGWLRPAFAAPAILALAAVVVFQAVGTIPSLREGGRRQRLGQVYESSFRLNGKTRGESIPRITIRPNEAFALDFDFTPSRSYPSYVGNLIGPSGSSVLTFEIRGDEENRQLYLAVPGVGLQPGFYELVVAGRDAAKTADVKAGEVLRLALAVEFRTH